MDNSGVAREYGWMVTRNITMDGVGSYCNVPGETMRFFLSCCCGFTRKNLHIKFFSLYFTDIFFYWIRRYLEGHDYSEFVNYRIEQKKDEK